MAVTLSVSGPRFDSGNFFFPSSFFFRSLFQLEFKSWYGFNPYQIPISFLKLLSFLPFSFPSFTLLFFLLFLSSSNFFLPFSPAFLLFSFSYSFLFLFFLFLLLVSFFLSLSAAFLSLFPPFFILLISSSFPPLLSFLPLDFFLVLPLYQGGCYEHKG